MAHHPLLAAAAVLCAAGVPLAAQQFAAPALGDALRNASAATCDFDGDGVDDLVISVDGEIRVIGAAGTLRATVRSIPLPRAWLRVYPGDLDGDGDVDFYLVNLMGGALGEHGVYRNSGAQGFALEPMPLGVGSFVERLIDVDGDGDLDVMRLGGLALELYVNDGSGTFARDASLLPPSLPMGSTNQLIAGDVNGDGIEDVLLPGNYPAHVLLSQPGGGYALGPFPTSSATEHRNGVLVDVDGDGDLDAVLSGEISGNYVFVGDGSGGFAISSRPMPQQHVRDLVAADVDGDGDVDLVGSDLDMPGAVLWINDGTGGFVDASAVRLPQLSAFYQWLAVGDFDGDGDPDVYLANGRAGVAVPSHLLVNRHVHLAIDAEPVLGGSLAFELGSAPGYLSGAAVALVVVGAEADPPLATRFGPLHVQLTGAISLPFVTLPAPQGLARQLQPVPSDPGLLGLSFAVQGLVLDPAGVRPARFTGYDRFEIR